MNRKIEQHGGTDFRPILHMRLPRGRDSLAGAPNPSAG